MYAVTIRPIHTDVETVPKGTVLPFLPDGEHYAHILLPVTGKKALVPLSALKTISIGEARTRTVEAKIRAFLADWLREKARLKLQTWSTMLTVENVVWCTAHAAACSEAAGTRAPETALLILAVRYMDRLTREIENHYGFVVKKNREYHEAKGCVRKLTLYPGWYLLPPEPPERKPYHFECPTGARWILAMIRPRGSGEFNIMLTPDSLKQID